jgi:hypothetical protein
MQLANLTFRVYHDEDVAIYINGVQAASAPGYSTTYVYLPMNAQGQSAIISNATNLIAVSCYQSTGGQFIDVGISDEELIANTYTVPTDAIGFWPLDATNGSVAVDASGNGNNGAVHGATWSPNGEVNDCLSFNGINNYVQITNPVSGDFSVAVWVKTTQIGGTGEWYDGAGLVDGDYTGIANDFGTSLVGNKFAFGVGNPDTTILSTNAINDGNWHLCVATRVQATGLMSVYVDGNLQATGTAGTQTLNASGSLYFGQIASGGGNFNGSLDQIEILGRALGSNEVTALYNNGTLPQSVPVILQGPVSQSVGIGGTASFSAQAIGGNLSYQWEFAGSPILGATNNTFIMTNVSASATGGYSIVVSNAAGIATNAATLTVQQPPVILLHRYSFVSNAVDSIGGANGTLIGPNGGTAASINHGLVLPGNTHGGFGYSGYVALPAGLLTATTNLTVECWMTQKQGNSWAEIWDFGNNGSQNFALIPYPVNNGQNMEVALTPPSGELDLQSAVSFPNGAEQYVCVTYDSSTLTGNLFTNGVLVANRTFPNNGYTPGFIGGGTGTTNNTLGNDVYGDDQFSGTIYELRIWNGVVPSLYLLVSAAAGPSTVATNLTPLSLSMSLPNGSMSGGATQQASVSGNFTGASGLNVTSFATNWTSSNTNVLAVNSSGLVTAIDPGTSTISATVNGVMATSASITVSPSAPSITQQPLPALTLLSGATLSIQVANAGSPPFVYFWYFDSGTNPISVSGAPTLTISNLQPANAGNYTCLVSNQYGSATSSALNLSIVTPTRYQQSLLSLGPIAYWPLSETSGTVAHDLIGGNNGSYVGGCTLAQSGPTNSIFGFASASVLFDGTSGHADIPEGPFNITGPLTTVAWINVITVPTFAGIIGHGDSSWRMSVNGTGEPGASDGSATDATSTISIADGAWHFIAYTYGGASGPTNGVLYVDGAEVASQSVTTAPPGDGLDVWIGGSPDYGTARLLNAKIAHAAIFNQTLTATQIQELYAGIYTSPVKLDIRWTGTNAVLTWPAGTLLQGPAASGPWTAVGSAVSPYSVPAGPNAQFFRVLVNP